MEEIKIVLHNAERADIPVTFLKVWGEIDLRTAPKLKEKVSECSLAHKIRVVLDFRNVSYFDSAAIKVMIYALSLLRLEEGGVFLIISDKNHYRVLYITGISKLIPVYWATNEKARELKGAKDVIISWFGQEERQKILEVVNNYILTHN
ncbi:hypothetical protein AUK11_00830 [bacterium CG2_30_37_16]|nr:MAG: hypothetical protein AUK11_00830 [bacterium CG2_30_37_16]PIP31224.1 MAG: hypothetical protein COX25_00495 [bacterium (Candidatus Howlettbacteria) CG23_combo_of_CG06-09_8_20_14_all_37_9]PIY00407.1 MAG: hypothetical protein COZ22_00360 [bacterium (Candidatus Howlettbacteria) CG_4_10_14_3_um_filter_37_10]PJB06460.1 MAG: hypothetical protein CO123_02185 [bacterium (Candidatus Howlettbacteria) CG_4_9_14_3_um_filter_37_10]